MRNPRASARPRGPRAGRRYDPEALIAAGKWSKEQQAKIRKVMEEFKAGTLESSNGSKVTNKRQALAIALSEAKSLTAAAFDESKHKRHPRGDERGGQFAPKEIGRKTADSVIEETRQKHGEEGVKELVEYELSEEGKARGREMSEEPDEYHEGWEERLREERVSGEFPEMEGEAFDLETRAQKYTDQGWQPTDGEPGEWIELTSPEGEVMVLDVNDEYDGQVVDEEMGQTIKDEDEREAELSDDDEVAPSIAEIQERVEAGEDADEIIDSLPDWVPETERERLRKGIRGETASAMTASAAGLAPMVPPKSWFEKPKLDGPTAMTVTADGQVFGHAALWGTCHTGMPGVCRTPPRSQSDYRFFHLGEVDTDDGPVHVGRVSMDTGHAPLTASRDGAVRHYDDTGTGIAHVRAYEDEHGIVLAGALVPDAPAEKARRFRGATVSGDWRSIGGKLELVGMLAVNVPGFPVPRAMAASLVVEDEPHTMALVAAGIYTEHDERDDERKLKALTVRAMGGVDGLVSAAMGGTKSDRRMRTMAASAVPRSAPPE